MKEYLEDVPLCTIPINIGKHWVADRPEPRRRRAAGSRACTPIPPFNLPQYKPSGLNLSWPDEWSTSANIW
jgi:hypothetical protein